MSHHGFREDHEGENPMIGKWESDVPSENPPLHWDLTPGMRTTQEPPDTKLEPLVVDLEHHLNPALWREEWNELEAACVEQSVPVSMPLGGTGDRGVCSTNDTPDKPSSSKSLEVGTGPLLASTLRANFQLQERCLHIGDSTLELSDVIIGGSFPYIHLVDGHHTINDCSSWRWSTHFHSITYMFESDRLVKLLWVYAGYRDKLCPTRPDGNTPTSNIVEYISEVRRLRIGWMDPDGRRNTISLAQLGGEDIGEILWSVDMIMYPFRHYWLEVTCSSRDGPTSERLHEDMRNAHPKLFFEGFKLLLGF